MHVHQAKNRRPNLEGSDEGIAIKALFIPIPLSPFLCQPITFSGLVFDDYTTVEDDAVEPEDAAAVLIAGVLAGFLAGCIFRR